MKKKSKIWKRPLPLWKMTSTKPKADLKKKKYGALREAINARNEMDKVVQEELTKLNLTHNPWTVQPSRHLFWR